MRAELEKEEEELLLENLESFRDALEEVGAEGLITVSFSPDGCVEFVGTINNSTNLKIELKDTGACVRRVVEYFYG